LYVIAFGFSHRRLPVAFGFMDCSRPPLRIAHDVHVHDWNSGYGAAANRVKA
jgi:hypothetical protein